MPGTASTPDTTTVPTITTRPDAALAVGVASAGYRVTPRAAGRPGRENRSTGPVQAGVGAT
jgi:hypothetical protein